MTEISQSDARLFYQLRKSDELQSLVSKVDDFEYTVDDLYDEEIRTAEDALIVFLRFQENETTNYIARGVFEEDDSGQMKLESVWIEKFIFHSPLTGHGFRWFYEGGEIVEREWES